MALVRQMPELYLRGSLANVTMANLTANEKDHIDTIVGYVATHPGMARHRAGIIEELEWLNIRGNIWAYNDMTCIEFFEVI